MPNSAGFFDAKGVSWNVAWPSVPDAGGRIVLHFSSTTGKRRSAAIHAGNVAELRSMTDEAWRHLLANAAVIELE